MNYFPFHIGDYVLHTKHLTLLEDLAYRRILDLYYTTEGAIPAGTQSVCRLIGMREHQEDVETVLNEFFTKNDAGDWVNARCDAEIAKYQAQADRARTNGCAGGRPKQANKEPSRNPVGYLPVANDNPTKSQSKANQNQEPEPEPEPIASKKNTSAVATPDGVTESVWEDFCQLRKSKKAKLTQTAVDGIQREASKAGWGLEAAIRECCARGWIGFKAEWVADKGRAETAYQRSMREKYEVVAPSIAARNPSTVVQNIDPNTYFAELAKAKTLEIAHA